MRFTAAQLREATGKQVRAFHPGKFGVINYGTLVKVGTNTCKIRFLEGNFITPIEHVVEVLNEAPRQS